VGLGGRWGGGGGGRAKGALGLGGCWTGCGWGTVGLGGCGCVRELRRVRCV
jgi:hypothetical protein